MVAGEAAHLKGIPVVILIEVLILSLTRAYLSGTLNLLLRNYISPDEIFEPASDEDGREPKDDKSGKCLMRQRCYLTHFSINGVDNACLKPPPPMLMRTACRSRFVFGFLAFCVTENVNTEC